MMKKPRKKETQSLGKTTSNFSRAHRSVYPLEWSYKRGRERYSVTTVDAETARHRDHMRPG